MVDEWMDGSMNEWIVILLSGLRGCDWRKLVFLFRKGRTDLDKNRDYKDEKMDYILERVGKI